MCPITKLFAGLAIAVLGSGCSSSTSVSTGDVLDARLSLTWAVESPMTNAPVSCDSVGADTVRVLSKNLQNGFGYTNLLACPAGAGITSPLPAGNYDVTVELVHCGVAPSCIAPTVLQSVDPFGTVAVFGNMDIDLGDVVFHAPAAATQ